jgi:hypothetical protein
MEILEKAKLNQLISRTDMTGNEKVKWLVEFIDKRELELQKSNVKKRFCKCGNELTEKEIFYETCLKCDNPIK